jgi:hypothetical protein
MSQSLNSNSAAFIQNTQIVYPINNNVGGDSEGYFHAKPSDFDLREGMTVAALGSNDPDIYIINDAGYKRLFLNPVIFGFYGHLGGFKYLTNINSQVRDSFKTSVYFKNSELGDGKIYALEVTGEDMGVLHHINMTAEKALSQDEDFFNKVFSINNKEFNWYTKNGTEFGNDYTSLAMIPAYQRNEFAVIR